MQWYLLDTPLQVDHQLTGSHKTWHDRHSQGYPSFCSPESSLVPSLFTLPLSRPPPAGLTQVCPAQCRHNIEPSCTLHWFVHPHWFDLNGAFANADNIDVYVDWACTAFRLFGEFYPCKQC